MAIIESLEADEQVEWEKWVQSRAIAVRQIAERLTPWRLYRMKSTGQRVVIESYGEHVDGHVTLTVSITGKYNAILFDRSVFGIEPDDLEECELPKSSEGLGASMNPEQVNENQELLRVLIRPDLFELRDGKACRINSKKKETP